MNVFQGRSMAALGLAFVAVAFLATGSRLFGTQAGQTPVSVPKDLEIVYGTGATHAEWGRTTYRILADGVMTVEKTRGYGSREKKETARYALAAEEIGRLIR